MSHMLNTTRGPARELSLLEFLAHGGGLADRGGDLRSIEAHEWHKSAPFRAKLVRDDGVSLDTAARQAWDAGYFGDGCDWPDVNALIELIAEEMHGRRIWSQTGDKFMDEIMAECESRAGFYGEGSDMAETFKVENYERPYVTKKGRHGVSYYGKVTRDGRSVFHHVYHSAEERDAAVQSFIMAEG